MAACLGADVASEISVASCNLRTGTFHYQAVQIAQVDFGQRLPRSGKLPHVADGVIVIKGLQVILERLAANGDACSITSVVSMGLSVFPSIALDV